jgi:cell division protein FtsB
MLFLGVSSGFCVNFALMKEKLKKIFATVKNFTVKNIMWIVGVLFVVWITFFDDFSLIDRFEKMSKLHELRENEKYYEQENLENSTRLEELMSGKEKLEKFAREQYYMKEEDEDIFLVILEEE